MAYFLGVDVGSLSCDAVLVDEAARVVAWSVVPTGARNLKAIERARKEVLEASGVRPEDLVATVATGYGRDRVDGRIGSVTEITLHRRQGRLHDEDRSDRKGDASAGASVREASRPQGLPFCTIVHERIRSHLSKETEEGGASGTMARPAKKSRNSEDVLLAKIRSLPPERMTEVEDFVDFLRHRQEEQRLVMVATRLSEEAFGKVWDNEWDAVYDDL